jgi:hypothetical protein
MPFSIPVRMCRAMIVLIFIYGLQLARIKGYEFYRGAKAPGYQNFVPLGL